MTLGSRGSRRRCLVVWCGATTAFAGTALLTRAGLVDAAVAVDRHQIGSLPLDRAVADLAAALLMGCATWLWLLTSYVVVEAAHGRPGRPDEARWVPVGLRRLVLSACGVAIAGALAQPAVAATGNHLAHPPHSVVHSPVTGLPLPERAAVVRQAAPRPHHRVHPGLTVVVARGDTLWSLAARDLPANAPDAVVARRWRAIYVANRDRIGPDPDLIVPGLLLRLPGKELP